MNKQQYILEKLITKYEHSVLYRKGSSLNLKIKIKIRQLYPHYDASDFYRERKEIDEIVNQLHFDRLIDVKYDDEGIVEVALVLTDEALEQAYRLINRPFNRDNEKKTLTYLEKINIKIIWLNKFINEMIKRLVDHQSINHYLPIDNPKDLEDIIVILQCLDKQPQEISLRKLSLKLFNDSKRFENLKGKIVNIINDYYEENFDDEEEMLAHFNIIKNPGFIYLSGNIVIEINGQIIDLGKLKGPFSLMSKNIEMMKIIEIKDDHVLTVENLTSFYDLNLSNTLIVYLGGYHNALRRKLLTNIYELDHNLDFYHFGDIDAGGFYIYLHLIEKTGISFKTLAMNKDILIKYANYCKKLTANDRKKLSNLKEYITDGTIEYMLEHNIKLEQEIVEIEDIKII